MASRGCKERRVPELLAPAGTPEALEAAVTAGADAVYLGGSRFGARAGAGFDARGLVDAIDLAHSRDVFVYITFNTSITDTELSAVAADLVACYAAGADAVLVQDPGVASLARDLVPDLPLHASTQMTVHSVEGVRAVRELGCTRVVLARELSLAEIEECAAAEPGVELEVFAHGALCYSWSGQCLLSSAIGGRSGNRGRCAQPCRKPYRLLRGDTDEFGRLVDPVTVPLDEKYLLSPRDLWTYPELARLAAAPIAALKIEGRLRSPDYVRTVVGIYRRALDHIVTGEFVPDPDDLEALRLAFNRDFTLGRLFEESGGRVMGRDRPGPRGLRIGTVTSADRDGRIAIRLDDSGVRLGSGDGIVVAPAGRPEEDVGTVLHRAVDGRGCGVHLNTPVPVGAPVFLTSRGTKRTFPAATVDIDLEVEIDPDLRPVARGVVLRRRGAPVQFETVGEPMAPAMTRPLTVDAFEAHLRRTGETPYRIAALRTALPDGLFATASSLNAFRRRALAAAYAALVQDGRPDPGRVEAARGWLASLVLPDRTGPTPLPADLRIRVFVDSVEGARTAAASGADEVCFELPVSLGLACACRASGKDAAMEQLRMALRASGSASFVWKWPKITRRQFLDRSLPLLNSVPTSGVMIEGMGAALAVRTAAPDIPLHGGPGMPVWNHRAAGLLASGFSSLSLSPELWRHEIEAVIASSRSTGNAVPFAVQVQGSLEVMVTDDCIVALDACPAGSSGHYALEDERRRWLPVLPDGECRTRLLNAVETCLIDRLPELRSAGVGILEIDARGRPPAYVAATIESYRTARALLVDDAPGQASMLTSLKDRLRAVARGGITAGAYRRGRREG
jgi:putative protease